MLFIYYYFFSSNSWRKFFCADVPAWLHPSAALLCRSSGGHVRLWSYFSLIVASVQHVSCRGFCLSGCLSGNPVVKSILLHVVRPGGGRHAPVRVQEDTETTDNQQAEEDEEDEDEDEGRLLLQCQEGCGRRGWRGWGQVQFWGGEGAAVQVVGHVGMNDLLGQTIFFCPMGAGLQANFISVEEEEKKTLVYFWMNLKATQGERDGEMQQNGKPTNVNIVNLQ